ncbi:MAG: carboxypeptidase-like regulatory domain-containing protein [Treponema sp.]|jgi:hypothetical protein|nr:carboxypeptidase-like regulatory domain-containing protein [Treponema sp.]
MINLTEKSRKILRAVYRGVGVAAVSLTVSACPPIFFNGYAMYGPGPDIDREEIHIQGHVKCKKTGNPINGIAIWIKDYSNYYTQLTSLNGSFYLYLPVMDNYTIIFTDIDGEENGGRFKQYTINLTKEEIKALAENQLIIELELED